MKRRNLIRRIAQEAMRQGVEWKVHREGANHTIYLLGGTRIPIPRHTEIGERGVHSGQSGQGGQRGVHSGCVVGAACRHEVSERGRDRPAGVTLDLTATEAER